MVPNLIYYADTLTCERGHAVTPEAAGAAARPRRRSCTCYPGECIKAGRVSPLGISSDPSLEKLLLFQPGNLSDHQPPCVTRTLLLLSSTMAPACARPASPVMTPPGLSSPPSLDAPGIRFAFSKYYFVLLLRFIMQLSWKKSALV